jgi:hypothetical protein
VKNIFLSVVVISALAVAGISGTLADFSDSEEQLGDRLQAGSLDLQVNGEDDPMVLPAEITGMVPDKSYHIVKDVANVGTINGWLYIHFKNAICTENNDKDLDGDGQIEPGMDDKPEPEKVAEFGGQVGQQMVDGLGERCDMEKHIRIFAIEFDGVPVDISAYDKDGNGHVKLDEVECEQILIGQLLACGEVHTLDVGFIIQDVLDPDWQGDPKFSYWPTNCYQGDVVTFDVLYELLQTDYTPPGGGGF